MRASCFSGSEPSGKPAMSEGRDGQNGDGGSKLRGEGLSHRPALLKYLRNPYPRACWCDWVFGRGGAPTSVGSDGPCTSASSRPTRPPMELSAKAKLAATVDFPTPPLQLLIPMSAPTWRNDGGALFPMNELGLAMLELT